jgi:hypothetical protein
MRGGIITVEKVAVNAVMAGAKPEYFPVILAAMEALAMGWENDKMFYHTATTGGPLSYFLILVNGPIAKELGIEADLGYLGAGNHANNTIGRAIKLCWLNIAHNDPPYIDTANRAGRWNDHTMLVVAEQEDKLPEGWNPHHVEMGFDLNQSTVTVNGCSVGGASTTDRFHGGGPHAWTMDELLKSYRSANTQCSIMVLTPAMAELFAEEHGIDSKYALKSELAMWNTNGTRRTAQQGPDANARGYVHPIVAGGDQNRLARFSTGTNASQLYATQLITGATLTNAGQDPTAPGTPKNFRVTLDTEEDTATLTWEAPESDGGMPVTKYQVYNLDGGQRATFTWIDVPAGAMSYTFNIQPGVEYLFRVRACSDLFNSVDFVTITRTTRASGIGSWACWPQFVYRP